MKARGAVLLAAVVVTGALVIGCNSAPVPAEYVITVEGMNCPSGCPAIVRSALQKLPEIDTVEIHFEERSATIKTTPGTTLTKERIERVLKPNGYGVASFAQKTG